MEFVSRSQPILIIPDATNKIYDNLQECPICQNPIKFEIKYNFLEEGKICSYPQIIFHGKPLHAFIVYVNASRRILKFRNELIQRSGKSIKK